MNAGRKLALGILSPLFIVLLFTTAFDIGFVRTATHPQTVKKLVAESGIYDSVIPSVLQQTKSIDTSLGTLSASDPAIVKAANQAVSPQYVKQNTEAAIDSVYKWLDGKTAQPEFKVDLAAAKASFADNVAAAIQQKLGSLPACTTAQSVALSQGGQFDAVNATCLPRGITAASSAGLVKSDLAGGQAFLDKTTISADSLKNSGSSQSVFETGKVKDVPKQYQRAKKTPLILSVLTILAGAGIVFLSRSWQQGLRHIAINLVVVGLIMLVFSWVLNRTVSSKVVPNIMINNTVLQKDIRNLANDLTHQIDKNYWFFGGLYTVLGVSGLAASEIFRRKSKPVPADAAPVSSQEAKPAKTKKSS